MAASIRGAPRRRIRPPASRLREKTTGADRRPSANGAKMCGGLCESPSGLLLLGDDRLDPGRGAAGQLDLDHVGADVADRLARGGSSCGRPAGREPRAIASAISLAVTEPNSLPSSPARWWIVSTVFESSAAVSSARSAASRAARSARLAAALGLLEDALGGRLGQLARAIVAQVAGRDVDRLAGLAEALDVLEQDRLRHAQRSPT